jgi:hypothetical protein
MMAAIRTFFAIFTWHLSYPEWREIGKGLDCVPMSPGRRKTDLAHGPATPGADL